MHTDISSIGLLANFSNIRHVQIASGIRLSGKFTNCRLVSLDSQICATFEFSSTTLTTYYYVAF